MTNCAAALVETMRDIKSVGKHDRNEKQNFNFRGIDAVVNEVGPALRDHGVLPIPEVLEYTHTLRESRGGGALNHYVVKVCYHFTVPLDATSPTGNAVQSVTVYGEAMDAGDKGLSKAMSVAYRTALLQMFAIPTGDPDPDSESHELAEQQGVPKNPGTVPEIRAKIVRYLQANRSPAPSIDDIATEFAAFNGTDIREATYQQLTEFYEQVSR